MLLTWSQQSVIVWLIYSTAANTDKGPVSVNIAAASAEGILKIDVDVCDFCSATANVCLYESVSSVTHRGRDIV